MAQCSIFANFSIFFKNGPAVFCKASLKEYLVSMNSIQAPAVALITIVGTPIIVPNKNPPIIVSALAGIMNTVERM